MIESIKEIRTVKAIDLPPTFDVLIGDEEYPMEIMNVDSEFVYVVSHRDSQVIHIPVNEIVSVLVPDTWENARYDIEFDLMKEGLL